MEDGEIGAASATLAIMPRPSTKATIRRLKLYDIPHSPEAVRRELEHKFESGKPEIGAHPFAQM
jgi:hypothetical protein